MPWMYLGSAVTGITLFVYADVNAAVFHALGLLGAHAVYVFAMAIDDKPHAIRTGPTGTVMTGSLSSLRYTILWAAIQVRWC